MFGVGESQYGKEIVGFHFRRELGMLFCLQNQFLRFLYCGILVDAVSRFDVLCLFSCFHLLI